MYINIRQENGADLPEICDLLDKAFANIPESDHQEKFLVQRLHKSTTFIPQLSLVGESFQKIVGYILLTKVEIVSDVGGVVPSLSVAPVAVLPEFQGQGVGAALMEAAHRRAASLGYGTALVLGHPGYYARFGYRRAIDFGIQFPFAVPQEFCMVKELIAHAANGVSGEARYPEAFLGN